MILKGSERGGWQNLAAHLLNTEDNDVVEVDGIHGFMAGDVAGAFQEIYAASRATNCSNYMFSLSLSPPPNEAVSNEVFRRSADEAIKRLGLSGQPHVLIFHEKNGRKHAHLVVSRIDEATMKSINLPFFKDKLCDLSRTLFMTHEWDLPKGHVDRALSDELSYSLEEYQVAKRAERDPKSIKAFLKDCWAQSDEKASFANALSVGGFQLCQGDRRGFVAVDRDGNIYSLSRWLDIKPKGLKARLGDPSELPAIEEVQIPKFDTSAAQAAFETATASYAALFDLKQRLASLQLEWNAQILAHTSERKMLKAGHKSRRLDQVRLFQKERLTLRSFWAWASGTQGDIIAERRAVLEKLDNDFEEEMLELSHQQRKSLLGLRHKITQILTDIDTNLRPASAQAQADRFIRVPDHDALLHKSLIRKSPENVLKLLTDKKAVFTRNDIVRKLADNIEHADDLRIAIDLVLKSPELKLIDDTAPSNPRFTTRSFSRMQENLFSRASAMAGRKAFGVRRKHLVGAIARQNTVLKQTSGAQLSTEQCTAIEHVLNRRQLCAAIGFAGAGKSTMLSAANDALTRQGYRVFGASLSGKAADGLQQASNISSRTLASWELGWQNGRNLLRAGDVLVIDEAGMVGSAQLSRIVEIAQKQNAKVIMVGDPEQLQPINAGTPFQDICEKIGHASLREIRRQKVDWQKQASIDLAEHRTAQAIEAYQHHGAIELTDDRQAAIASLVENYMVDCELNGSNASRLALAHRRADVFAINQSIRLARKSAGELQDEITFQTDHGPRSFAKGDRLLFTRNDAQLGIRNGMIGTIKSISKNQLDIELNDHGGKAARNISINPKRYTHIDHGYASTIHRTQGATVDNAYVLASPTMDRHLMYVAMSRHRNDARVFASKSDFPKGLSMSAQAQSLSNKFASWHIGALEKNFANANSKTVIPEKSPDIAMSHKNTVAAVQMESDFEL